MNAMLKEEVKSIFKAIRELHTFCNDKEERDEAIKFILRECTDETFTSHRYTDARKKK